LGQKKKGICSKWIESSITEENKEGLVVSPNKIIFSFNSGTLPKISNNENLIMIATGTGIAPFRNFLLDRFYRSKSESFIGSVTLFFGCRNKELDFLYGDEYEMFKNCPQMKFDYHVAFSRDQNEKIYVQDLIKKNCDYVYEMIFIKKCYVFLVGNSKVLPKSLDNALKYVYNINKGEEISEEEWNKILHSLKKSGKFYIETW